MRWILLILLAASAAGQTRYELYASAVNAKNWVAGAKLAESGLLRLDAGNRWEQRGFVHPMILAADYDRRDPSTLFLAAGNGLIRAKEGGQKWRITTSWDVTELRDVTVDAHAPGTVYFSHTEGIRKSSDGGDTWKAADEGIEGKYCETLQADHSRRDRVLAGCEGGIYLTEDGGAHWNRTGAEGVQVRRLAQSPHRPNEWLAGTQMAGLLRSIDGGETWESAGDVAVERNLYDIAYDPTNPKRVAIGGFGIGVMVSEDDGETWERRSMGFPRWDVWSLAFDPEHPGRLYASVHEEAIYVSDDAGKNWRSAGMEGSYAYRLQFFPEAAQ